MKKLYLILAIIVMVSMFVMASPVQAWEFPWWTSATENLSGGGSTGYVAIWTGPLILGIGTNTDAQLASAVLLKHTAGTDTALGTVGTKNPPIDADLAIYRDSTSTNALVTSTWAQVKAFLKTYFDSSYVHSDNSTLVLSNNIRTGSAQMNNGDNTTIVSVGFTPTRVQIIETSNPGAVHFWVGNKTSSAFTIYATTAVSSNTTFDWRATLNENN